MDKKVLLQDLVENGRNVRKQIISKVVCTDRGVYPIGELWDANTTINTIVDGATIAFDTLKEVEVKLNSLDRDLNAETARAKAAEQALDAAKADKATTLEGYGITDAYTKQEIDDKLGGDFKIVDQYAIYQFTSYDHETGAEWAQGRAQLTGIISGELTQVIVLENTEPGFVGQKFFIPSNANPDGETKYQLYDAEKQDTGIDVTILKESDTTYKDTSIKEYIDFMFQHAGGGYSGQVPFDSVGSAQIIDNSIGIQDLSDEVKDKLQATVDEESENATFH